MNIGENLRRLRVKIGLTQEELANRCELTKGFISQIERDLTSPSIATLIDILECLGTNLKDFFNETDDYKVIFEKEDIFIQENEDEGHTINWIVPNAQKNMMEPILIDINPFGKSSRYSPHEGEIFGYVLKGQINLTIGDNTFKATKGESFYYKANAPYWLHNIGKQQASVLWVCTPPKF